MSEPSKRDRAVESLGRLFRRASRCVGPEPGDVEALVDLLIDAAKAEIRAEMAEEAERRRWVRLEWEMGQPYDGPISAGAFAELKRLREKYGPRTEET